MNLLFWRKPKKCPQCGLPYKKLVNVHEWYTGGWVSGGDNPQRVPLEGHAEYEDGRMLHYEFPWQDLREKYGEEAFNINLGLMPEHILICGCGAK